MFVIHTIVLVVLSGCLIYSDNTLTACLLSANFFLKILEVLTQSSQQLFLCYPSFTGEESIIDAKLGTLEKIS